MPIITLIIQILVAVVAILAAMLSIMLFLRLHWPAPALWIIKLYVSALSPVLVSVGMVSAIVGLATGSRFISVIGMCVAIVFLVHIFRVTRPPSASSGFESVFGMQVEGDISRQEKRYLLKSRTALKLPAVPRPQLEQNISFVSIPGTDQRLLCDVWQPSEHVVRSGLAFIYLHGSAWYMLDKDLGTRPFFGQLAAQGHVIMDVAYRLSPETDLTGMVHDVNRAINWMKENAGIYGIDPDRIVVGGGSAGAHLALLTAYTTIDPAFTPSELEGRDLGVKGVISLYGPADLEAMYFHLSQHLTLRDTPGKPRKAVPTKLPEWMIRKMGKEYYRLHFDKKLVDAGAIPLLMGGHPHECPERYAVFSPITHVHADCPPTLLIHGEHDIMAPVESTRQLYARLVEKKVQAVLHILPQTDHAFDLQIPGISPSAHNALYDVERFLEIMSATQQATESLRTGLTNSLLAQ